MTQRSVVPEQTGWIPIALTLGWMLVLGLDPLAAATAELTVLRTRLHEGITAFDIALDLQPPTCPPGEGLEVLEATAVLVAEPLPVSAGECTPATPGEDFRPRVFEVPLGGSRTHIRHRISGLLVADPVSEGCEVFQLRVDRIEPMDPMGGSAQVRCSSSPMSEPIDPGGTAQVWILDDDLAPTTGISIRGGPVPEGDTGTRPAVFQVALAQPSFSPVQVDWTTVDGTASTADGDYLPSSGRLTFVYPETEMQIQVPVASDRRCEGDESFQVQLQLADGNRPAATAVVIDDDGAPQVNAVSGGGQTGEAGQELAEPLVIRARDGDIPLPDVPVRWEVTAGSAFLQTEPSTDTDGRARARVTLGPEPGPVEVRATVEGGNCPEASTTFRLQVDPPEEPPPNDPRLESISPQGTVAVEGVRNVHGVLLDRLTAVRGPGGGSRPRPLRGFLGNSQSSGKKPSDAEGEGGFDFDLASYAAGLDAELGGGFLVGGALAFTEGDARRPGRDDGLDSEAWSGSLFAAWQSPLGRGHLEGILTGARPRFSTRRVVLMEGKGSGSVSRLVRAEPEASLWALSLGGGAGQDFRALRLEGFGYLHWARVEIDRYVESGAGERNLEVFEQRLDSLLAEAGVELLYRFAYRKWGLALHLSSSFVHELEDDARTITGRLLGDPEAAEPRSFTIEPPDRDYFNLEGGATADLPGPWAAYLSFHKEVDREDLETESLLLGLVLQL